MADTKLKLEVIMAAVDRITRPLKAVMDGSRQTSGEVKALRDKIKGLNDQAGQIESFRKLQSQTAVVGHNMAAAQDKVRLLAQQLQATETPTKAMTKAFEAAKREAGQLSTQHAEMTQRVQRQRDALNEAGLATTALASHQRRLKGEVQSTTAALDAEQKKLESINQRAKTLKAAQAEYEKSKVTAGKLAGTGATMAVAGAAISAPVAKTVADYSKFEDAMLGVARQVDGARDSNGKLTKTYYDMANEIKRMSTTIPLATVEIAKIVEAGARMGIQGKENLIEFAKTTAMTATAFNLPVDQIGENMGKLAQLYKIPIPAISTLGDTINWLDDNALSKGGDIIDVMQRIAGTAAGVNMAAKEAAALGSTFLSLGARAEVAATASNAMIRELSIATMQPKRFQEGIKALGLSAQGLQVGMPKDATGTILNVLDKLKALPSDKRLEVATRIFGKEYGDDAAKLSENLDEYRRQLKLVNDEKAKGSMQREGDARNQTLSAGGQMLQNKFFNLSSYLGETQRESVVAMSQAIGGLLDKINAWTQANPGLTGALVKTAAVIASVLVGSGALALIIAAVLGPFAMAKFALASFGVTGAFLGPLLAKIVTAIKAAGTALLWVGRLFLANPIVAAAAAIAAAAVYVWTNWDTLGPKFWALWDGIKTGAAAAWAWVTDKARAAGQIIVDLFINWTLPGLIIKHWDSITSFIGALPAKFATMGGQIIDGLISGLSARWDSAKAWFAEMGNKIAQTTRDALGIKSPSRVFTEIGGHIIGGLTMGLDGGEDGPLARIKAMADKLTAAGAGAGIAIGMGGAMAAPVAINTYWEPIKTFFAGLWDNIKTGATTAWAWVTDKARAAGQIMVDLFMNWTLPGLIIKHWDSITTFIGALPAKFATMGGQIIDGLIGGLSARWDSAKAWFSEMGNRITQTTRDALGIKSPSRVFAEIGAHVMGGLTMGMDDGEDGPLARIKAMADKLTAAGAGAGIAISMGGAMAAPVAIDTRPPLTASAAASGPGAGTSVVNHITINAAPGMDEAALARLVAAEIDKATRRAQMAGRSRLTDRD